MQTTRVIDDATAPRMLRRKVRLDVLQGPEKGTHTIATSDEVNIGTLSSNDLVLTDPSVSRYHLRIVPGARGFAITDLDSTNGSFIHGLRVREVEADGPVDIRLGDSIVRFSPLTDEVEIPLHPSHRFGSLIGSSTHMRALFAQIDPVSASNVTVLIEGDTGTGKELLAEEIHGRSPRADGPFVVVDCGAIPDNLVESELFGHVRGSFTGATTDRAGAFELAHGGTLFLDEIGEMTASAQPRLLRVLEGRRVKRVGADRYRDVDVRIIAATNRDLRVAVNEGTFRADLYYRISVMRLRIPPLRERREDIEPLARHFLQQYSEQLAPGRAAPDLSPETLQRLVSHRWPGNVRELRNFMQRVAVMTHSGVSELAATDPSPGSLNPSAPSGQAPGGGLAFDPALPYKEAKARWVDQFEIDYVTQLLARNEGNVAGAAREAGVDRTYLFRLIRKYSLR